MAKPPRKNKHAAELELAKKEIDRIGLDGAAKLVDRLKIAIDVLKKYNVPISANTIRDLAGIWYNDLRRDKDKTALAMFRAHSTNLCDRQSSTNRTGNRHQRTKSSERSEARTDRLEQKLRDCETRLEQERLKYQEIRSVLDTVYEQNLALRGEIVQLKAELLRSKDAVAFMNIYKKVIHEKSPAIEQLRTVEPHGESSLPSSQFDDDLL